MKSKVVCFKLSKTMYVLFFCILLEMIFIVFQVKDLLEVRSFKQIQQDVGEIKQINEENIKQVELVQNTTNLPPEESKIKQVETRKEYESMPEEIKGYKVIGKITIPKLNLDTCILAQTTTKSLKVSVTKLYGPGINEVGNFCIAGHNYRNNKMFGGIKKLENKDKIILTDTYGESITYEVYENYQTSPKDVSSLTQETGGDREVTLITCTAGAIKRVIVKAVEVYD